MNQSHDTNWGVVLGLPALLGLLTIMNNDIDWGIVLGLSLSAIAIVFLIVTATAFRLQERDEENARRADNTE